MYNIISKHAPVTHMQRDDEKRHDAQMVREINVIIRIADQYLFKKSDFCAT